MRLVLVAVVGVLLLAGCGSRSGGAAPAPTPERAPTPTTTVPTESKCPDDGALLSVAAADAAMGVRVLTIEMVNCGDSLFTVKGYPNVRLFDERNEPIDVVVERGATSIATVPGFDQPPTEVTLRTGEKARTDLLWTNRVTSSTVDAVTATQLEATPATGKSWRPVPLVVPDELNGTTSVSIDLGNTRKVGVRAWQKS